MIIRLSGNHQRLTNLVLHHKIMQLFQLRVYLSSFVFLQFTDAFASVFIIGLGLHCFQPKISTAKGTSKTRGSARQRSRGTKRSTTQGSSRGARCATQGTRRGSGWSSIRGSG